MKYLSVCSGIEAATVAWHPLGWEAAAYSEIEKFPSAVLAHHYPTVPNLGDMTKFKEWDLDSIDLLVGGTPCQSFSVAGLRKGLEDPRGNLALVYCGILDRFRPQWFVWENVPGVLSSNSGRDFGSFLGALAELGYGFAYRVLDAQYFGVAQRRRRVFVVGYFGDWRPAAEVLFEPESVRGDPAPSRKAREGVTASVVSGAPVSDYDVAGTLDKGVPGRGIGHNGNYDSQVVSVGSLCARTGQSISVQDATQGHLMAQPIALAENTIGRKPENGGNGDGFTEGGPMYTLNATGVHGVAQPITQYGNIAGSLTARHDSSACADRGQNVLVQPMAYNIAPGKGALKDDIHVTYADATKTLDASGSNPAMHQGGAAIVHPILLGGWDYENNAHGPDDVTGPLLKGSPTGGGRPLPAIAIAQPISFSGQMSVPNTDVDMTPTLQALNPMAVAQPITAAFKGGQGSGAGGIGYSEHVAPTLPASDGGNRTPTLLNGMAVRRLTPVECERLQGFPDGYTNIPWRKAVESPDGPRYKALGNSMAVPVMAWIGKRINDYMEKQ